jgi:hypothetical protein
MQIIPPNDLVIEKNRIYDGLAWYQHMIAILMWYLCFNKNINFENGNIYINSWIIMHDIQKGTLWAIAYSKYSLSLVVSSHYGKLTGTYLIWTTFIVTLG